MWNGRKKAVTFSYDDGVIFDRKLVEIFNRYGMKCTFNLNSGLMSGASTWDFMGTEVRRMNCSGLPELYRGHEIAVHCLTHADLTKYDDETIINEIMTDKDNLERMFDCKIEGMAYPYGTFNDHIAEIIRKCGLNYARTTMTTEGAAVPSDLLRLKASCHHRDEKTLEYVKSFIEFDASESDEPLMLYIWGHSYEFEGNGNWELIEEICSMLSGRDDIFYGTNSEVLRPFYGK